MYAVKGDNTGNIETARHLEQKGELKAAADLYEKLYRHSKNLKIADRLIIVFRKLKHVKKELIYINIAIKLHEDTYRSKRKPDTKANAISKKLNILLGHADKKGKIVLKPDAIVKLQKRKDNLLKKNK